ncbi:cytochrome c oxidase subunit NDUFA4-like [Pomacea canaliculata]|uniref:cytochrome c oxidase subunit NDUFA4-like n=1 Tax=Pomacea canaliculata TaxID=400727 RepID=UPI000D73EDA0|nr:cytochrome c oxidase subunit NDUFA4-like [Pomacea canaliculata]
MKGLTLSSLKGHPSLIPLFVCVGTGVAGAAYYLLRLSTRNPDVSWKRDEVNEYPWNAYKPTDQYKFYSPKRDYSKEKFPEERPNI